MFKFHYKYDQVTFGNTSNIPNFKYRNNEITFIGGKIREKSKRKSIDRDSRS